MSVLETILLTFGSAGVIIGSVGYFAKSLINWFLEKDISKFEFELKAKSEATIERLKNEL